MRDRKVEATSFQDRPSARRTPVGRDRSLEERDARSRQGVQAGLELKKLKTAERQQGKKAEAREAANPLQLFLAACGRERALPRGAGSTRRATRRS